MTGVQTCALPIYIAPKAVAGELEQFKDRFLGNLGGAMFVLLPSFALWLKVMGLTLAFLAAYTLLA